jgi:hypothetical protein
MFDIDFTKVENAKTMRIHDNGDIIWGDFVGKHHTEIPNKQKFDFGTLNMTGILRNKCITVKGTNTIIAVQTDNAIYYFDRYKGLHPLLDISEDSSVANSGQLSPNDADDDEQLVKIQRYENESTQDDTWANYYSSANLSYLSNLPYHNVDINLKHICGMRAMIRGDSKKFLVLYVYGDNNTNIYIPMDIQRINWNTPIVWYKSSDIILAVQIQNCYYCYHETRGLIPFQYIGEIPPNLVYPWKQIKDTLDKEIYNADSLRMYTDFFDNESGKNINITYFLGKLNEYRKLLYVPLKHPDDPSKYFLSYVTYKNLEVLARSLLA